MMSLSDGSSDLPHFPRISAHARHTIELDVRCFRMRYNILTMAWSAALLPRLTDERARCRRSRKDTLKMASAISTSLISE